MVKSTRFLYSFISILIILLFQGINLQAQGTNHQQIFETQGMASSMGRITTVSTDGPFDVLRNPAILTAQKENNAAAAGISREAYNNFDSSINADVTLLGQNNISLTGISFSSDFAREFYMNCGIAYSRRFTDNFSAGIAASGTAETMKNKNTTRMDVSITTPGYTADLRRYSYAEETERNKTAYAAISAGYKFLSNLSAGIQIKAEYQRSEKSSTEETFAPNESSTVKTKKSDETASPVIGLGLHYRDSLQEAGLLLTSGRYLWERTADKTYYHDELDSSNNYDLKNNKLKDPKYTEGPGIIAGYYIQLNPLIGLALEAGCVFPRTYKKHTLMYLSEEKNYYDAETEVENKFAFMVNGGIKLNPYKDITAALGGGYRIISDEATASEIFLSHQTSKEKSDVKFTGYLVTLGLENKILQASKLVISMDLIIVRISSSGMNRTDKSYPNDSSSMEMEMEQKINGLFFNTGIAYVQYF